MVSNYEFNDYKACIDNCIADIKLSIAALGGGGTPVTADSVTTFKNKSMSGIDNTFTAIPYSVLTGAPTIPTNANYVDKSTNQLAITGTKEWLNQQTFSTNSLFKDNWANYQAIFGQNAQAGRIGFISGGGTISLNIGYGTAGGSTPLIQSVSSSGLILQTTNAAGTISLTTQAGEALKVNADRSVLLNNISALATTASLFLVSDAGVVKSRTAAQMLNDLNAAAKVSALDFEITDQTKGLIQKDRGDSIRKRLVVTNGVSTWEAA